ncbi:class II aldolase/adducin family protein [Salibacterium aidingense]|uniref:class II aldolase/adducin family protein n=1 Tax=Salibacterium aidingense TaxID=384933 RepID=UPI003BCC4B17
MDKMKAELSYPEPPTFETYKEERRHRKERLASAFRLFSKFGFDNGLAGHITVRDPEEPELFWVNKFGMHFSQISVSDLVLVNEQGDVIEGNGIVNGAALVIHSQIHQARPDVIAVAHTHSTYGMAWASLARKLDPISQDACAFYEDHDVFGKYNGVVLDYNEGEQLSHTLGDKKGLILANHGLLTVGKSVDETAWWFISMERCCQAQIMAESVGTPQLIDEATAKDTCQKVGSSQNGWYCYQPLWDRIKREQPDLLD